MVDPTKTIRVALTLVYSLFAVIAVAPPSPAAADSLSEAKFEGTVSYEVGDALICETQQQVERYIAHYSGDREAAIRAVNREEGDRRACGVVTAAFVRGPHIEAASHGDMAFEILRILVVGMNTASGIRAVPPVPCFAAFGVVEYDV
jgi:hypothetical protein